LFHCFDVVIDGINVFGQWRYNTDGIDVMNSQRITVKNSFVHSFDDTLVVKGIDRYRHESVRDHLFEHCVLWCDWGRALEIGLETAAPEYENVVFRDCDVLRGGNMVCDIQNGDWAEVHDITFENIRVELERFYTKSLHQKSEDQVYDLQGEIEIPKIVCIDNPNFREQYAHLKFQEGVNTIPEGDKRYASVHNVIFRDIAVYCDEEVLRVYGKESVTLRVRNRIPTTEYRDILIENVSLNGKRLSAEEMNVQIQGYTPEAVIK
jgi:hypothetical protein